MSLIPRKSEFTLTDSERAIFIKACEKELNSYKNPKRKPPEYWIEELTGLLNYCIGMEDFKAYFNIDSNTPEMKEKFQEFLTKRAYRCAMLQSLLEDVSEKGYSTEIPTFEVTEKNPDKNRFKSNEENSDKLTIYHGTKNLEVTAEELGKPDEYGKYHIKDGVLYFAEKKHAEKFAGKDGRVLSRDISDDDRWAKIPIASGYTCFLYQDELIDLCNSGVKYLYSCTPQILDIEHFSDFVQKRDETINSLLEEFDMRLPEKGESFFEYLDTIGVNQEKYMEYIDNISSRWSTNPKEEDEEFVSYDEMFEEIQQTLGEDEKIENLDNNGLTLQEIGQGTLDKFKSDTIKASKAFETLELGVKTQEEIKDGQTKEEG